MSASHDSPTQAKSRAAPERLACLLVALAAFLPFSASLGHGLVWDDPKLVGVVERLDAAGGLSRVLASPFVMEEGRPLGYWRPAVLASLWIENRVGASPTGRHLTNVLLHASCSALLFALLRALGAAGIEALLGSLLFALHPIHVESVAFVSGRTDLLAGMFLLAGTLAWVASRGARAGRETTAVAAGTTAFAVAVFAKETALAWPGVLLAWDAFGFPDRQGGWWRRNGRWLVGWSAVGVAAIALRWKVAGVGMGGFGSQLSPEDLSAVSLDRWLIPGVVSKYLRLLVLPWPQSAFYTAADVRLRAVDVAAAVALIGGLAWLGTKARHRGGWAGLAWILGFLAPAFGLVPIAGASVAERHLYIPSAGLAIASAVGLSGLAARAGRRVVLVWAAVLVSMALGVAVRVPVWRDDLTLFSNVVATSPTYPEGHYNLGVALQDAGQDAEATAAFRAALRLRPDYPDALSNVGLLLLAEGRPGEAVGALERAIRGAPGMAEAHNNLGIAYQEVGRYGDAVRAHARAVDLNPTSVAARNNLGNAWLGAGRPDRAVETYLEVLRVSPNLAPTIHNLGIAYLRIGDRTRAVERQQALQRLDPRLAASLAQEIASRAP